MIRVSSKNKKGNAEKAKKHAQFQRAKKMEAKERKGKLKISIKKKKK